MKTTQFLTLSLIALSGLTSTLRAADTSLISVRVEQVSDDKRTHFDESQKKSLKVYVTNGGAQDASVKVKYYIFAKDIKGKDTIVFKDGELPATVKSHATETVLTPEVVAKSVEQHRQGNTLGGNGRFAHAGKEVQASGDKIVGYGVQVRQDGKVVADYFSEPSLKTNVGGGN